MSPDWKTKVDFVVSQLLTRSLQSKRPSFVGSSFFPLLFRTISLEFFFLLLSDSFDSLRSLFGSSRPLWLSSSPFRLSSSPFDFPRLIESIITLQHPTRTLSSSNKRAWYGILYYISILHTIHYMFILPAILMAEKSAEKKKPRVDTEQGVEKRPS